MRTTARLGLAAVLLAAAATPALAQAGYGSPAYPPSTYDRGSSGYQTPAGGRPSQYDQNTRPGDYDRAERYGQPDRSDQGQGQDDSQALARQLNLTAAQRPAFDAYRRAFAPDEARGRQEEDEMRRMASLTTPQRLDAARAAQARDRADFDRTEAATRSFYAQLSPTQRRTFDRLTAPQMEDEGPDQGGPSPTQPTARPPR